MKNISKEKHGGLSSKMDVVDGKEGRGKGNSVLKLRTRTFFLSLAVQLPLQFN